MTTWHATTTNKGSAHEQGLIIDDNGRNVAVSYDVKDAELIAAAPELLAELQSAIFYIKTYGGEVTDNFSAGGNMRRVEEIIARAKGE